MIQHMLEGHAMRRKNQQRLDYRNSFLKDLADTFKNLERHVRGVSERIHAIEDDVAREGGFYTLQDINDLMVKLDQCSKLLKK